MFERLKQWVRYHAVKSWFERYERFLIPGALVLGVAIDFITFRTIQISTTFLITGIYLGLAALAMALTNLPPTNNRLLRYLVLFAPVVLQFTFGALLSASLIFYWFSGSFSVSWPLLAFVALLMTSNEVLRHWYTHPIVQVSVYFFCLFSLSTVYFPYRLNSIDTRVFLVGGGVSVFCMLCLIALLAWRLEAFRQTRVVATMGVIAISLTMYTLYVLNIIPPIPLSLREAGVYHEVKRVGSSYQVTDEDRSLFEQWLPVKTVHVTKNEPIFVFTSIFAPTDLHTQIVHRWQWHDEINSTWVDRDRLSFGVSGGRKDGYRGYSRRTSLQDGEWRVRVETPRGQVLATIRFDVQHVEAPVSVVELKK